MTTYDVAIIGAGKNRPLVAEGPNEGFQKAFLAVVIQ
jgi:hypothetical protein